jgi:hypothetical protein
MIIISHRGNLIGPDRNNENRPEQIKKALKAKLDVEIDVWVKKKKWFLGHNKPQYLISKKFLENPRLWCHAKNLDALNRMVANKKVHCFWHEKDLYTITSRKIIWVYPGQRTCPNSVLVSKGSRLKKGRMMGVCTDFPLRYRNKK